MYLSKGEHLMRIAETASHRPFQDHELSFLGMSQKGNTPDQRGPPVQRKVEPDQHRETGDDIDPLTPMAGTAGGIGRTPVRLRADYISLGRRLSLPVRHQGGRTGTKRCTRGTHARPGQTSWESSDHSSRGRA